MTKDYYWSLIRVAGDYGIRVPSEAYDEIEKRWVREPIHDEEAAIRYLRAMSLLTPEILARGPIYRVKPVENVVELYNEALRYDLEIPEDVEDEARERFDKQPGRNQESAHQILVDLGVLTPEILAKGPVFLTNPAEEKARQLEERVAEMHRDLGRDTT
jgi:hypothetical protein